MKKQIFSSVVTLSFISSLFIAGCERTKNTDEIPQATPEPIEIPVDTLALEPVTPDTLGQAYMDSVAVADSIALAKAADTLKTGAKKGNTVASSKTTTKKSTAKSTTKTTAPSGTGTSTTTTKKGTGTTNTGTGTGTTTTTQKKGSGSSSTGTGGGTTTTTQKKGTNP